MSKKENNNQDGMLELLASKHQDWVRIAKSFTNSQEDAEDLVQEVYIRIWEAGKTKQEVSFGNEPNRYFMWVTISNLFKSNYRHSQSGKVIRTTPIIEQVDDTPVTDYSDEKDVAFEVVMDKITELTRSWSVYDRQLFELYFMRGYTLRGIASGAKIGLNHVHNTITDIKKRIKAELGEDVQDFFNQDFNLINRVA